MKILPHAITIIALFTASLPSARAAIFIDQVVAHGSSGTGDDAIPPGVSGLSWCHIVSSVSSAELLGFMTANTLVIGQLATNMRTPVLGSRQTYYGLTPAMCMAAVLVGAITGRVQFVRSVGFDHPSGPTYWEP